MNRNAWTPFVMVTAVIGLVPWLSGCGGKPEAARGPVKELPAMQVRVAKVVLEKVAGVEEVVGTIQARTRATIAAKISGRIEELPVVLGQKVKRGDLIAKLDAAEIQARVDQAQATLDQAERDWKRASALFETRASTRAETDLAEARLRVAKAAANEAAIMLGYATIVAPFDGVVTRKLSEAGDLAQPGKPLVDLEDPSALQMQAEVPEAYVADIQSGAKMAVQTAAQGQSFTATVSEISPVADPASRTLRVKLDLPPAPGLKPGQFARLLVPTRESETLLLPSSAIVRRGQLEIVFTVADQKARLHLVKTGRILPQGAEILAGLDAGATVVVEGTAQLVDGQPVTLK